MDVHSQDCGDDIKPEESTDMVAAKSAAIINPIIPGGNKAELTRSVNALRVRDLS